MIFNSVTFLVFLAIVVPLYWVLPTRPRLWLIFLSSLTFYGFWRVEFVPVMMICTVIDYLAGLAMASTSDPARRRRFLWVSLTANLGMLFYFKYLLFFAQNVAGLAQVLGFDVQPPQWSIVLPLGISFYTFQTMSYTIDVYRGTIKAEKDFILYGSFVVFFPQLVAGPVLRASDIIDQLATRPKFLVDDLATGLRRVLFGLFLKVVFADNIGPLVDSGFEMSAGTLSALDVWTLAFLFGYQIYFDFSAYSHIALGAARMMGVRLPENFSFPYASTTPREFWQRWHISLSSWIRDYLYLPLVGSKVYDRASGGLGAVVPMDAGRRRTFALFATWAIMGLWHGAAWTFLVWGLFHAILIYGHRILSKALPGSDKAWRTPVAWVATLLLTMLSWIPFRATSLDDCFTMLATVIDPREYSSLGLRENAYLVAALTLVAIQAAYLAQTRVIPKLQRLRWVSFAVETGAYSTAVLLVFVFLRPVRQFIYFQF